MTNQVSLHTSQSKPLPSSSTTPTTDAKLAKLSEVTTCDSGLTSSTSTDSISSIRSTVDVTPLKEEGIEPLNKPVEWEDDELSVSSLETTGWLRMGETQSLSFKDLPRDLKPWRKGKTSSVLPLGNLVLSFPNSHSADANDGKKFLGEKLKALFFSKSLLSEKPESHRMVQTLGVAKSSTKSNFFASDTYGGQITLKEKIAHPKYSPNLQLLIEVLEGIHFLHKNGVLHRDIKLDNFFYNTTTETAQVGDPGFFSKPDEDPNQLTEKIIAFSLTETNVFKESDGLPNFTPDDLKEEILSSLDPQVVVGSATYLSPYLLNIDQDSETPQASPAYQISEDIYSLGILSLEFLTGKRFLPKKKILDQMQMQSTHDGHLDYQEFTQRLHEWRVNKIEKNIIKTKDGRRLSTDCLHLIKSMMAGTTNSEKMDLQHYVTEFKKLNDAILFKPNSLTQRLSALYSCMRN